MLPPIQNLFIKTLWEYQFISTLHLIMRRSSAEITNRQTGAVNILANLFFEVGSLLLVGAIFLFHNFCLSAGSFANIMSVAVGNIQLKKKGKRVPKYVEYIPDNTKRQHYYPLTSMTSVNFSRESREWVKPVISTVHRQCRTSPSRIVMSLPNSWFCARSHTAVSWRIIERDKTRRHPKSDSKNKSN